MNKITAHAVNIRTLLNNKYTVQYYQREYNWETKQIEELIEDLTNEFNEFYKDGDRQMDVRNYGEYFFSLGPIYEMSFRLYQNPCFLHPFYLLL
jgi:uncharacterized protein with ParB-like and HNH nuclease domain